MTVPRRPARSGRAAPRRLGLALTLALTLAAVAGMTLAASTTITAGTIEQSQGADVGESTPTYWTWTSSEVFAIPTPAPAQASTNPAAPTVLPAAGARYSVNAATAGQTGVRWVFSETAAAPASTELELRFVVGLSAAAVDLTVYVELQAAAHGTFTYRFFWDAGTVAPTSITISTMQTTVLACTSVGHCP